MKSYTDLEQSKKLTNILPIESADMFYSAGNETQPTFRLHSYGHIMSDEDVPCWSLGALLKLIPKHILRKDKIHYGQTFIPSFRWEITPTAIYYTDGNNIMDYVSFNYGYGDNSIELIDAVFKMVCWLKENNEL